MELIGKDFNVFRNTGTYAVPVWNKVTKSRDASVSVDWDTAEVKNRSSNFVKEKPTFKRVQGEFECSYDTAPDDFVALRDAALNGTSIDLWFADGEDATGTQGVRADFLLKTLGVDAPVENEGTLRFAAVPHVTANDPTWYTKP